MLNNFKNLKIILKDKSFEETLKIFKEFGNSSIAYDINKETDFPGYLNVTVLRKELYKTKINGKKFFYEYLYENVDENPIKYQALKILDEDKNILKEHIKFTEGDKTFLHDNLIKPELKNIKNIQYHGMEFSCTHDKNKTFDLTLYTITDSSISGEKLYFFTIETSFNEVDLLKEIYNLFDVEYDLILEDVSNIEDIRGCLSKEVLKQFKLPIIDLEKIDDATPINGTTPSLIEHIDTGMNPPPINNQ